MGKAWFRTAEQDLYLQEQVQVLLKARLDDGVKLFRNQLHETWEERWPEIKVLFPERTDADPQLTREQIEELSSAMALRKQVSPIPISVVTVFHDEILSIAIIYSRPLARHYEAHTDKKSEKFTCSLSSKGSVSQGQEGTQANNACYI